MKNYIFYKIYFIKNKNLEVRQKVLNEIVENLKEVNIEIF